jgi:hypothetical protein
MAAEREIHEFDTIEERTGSDYGGGIVEGAVSRAARDADFVQGLAAGSGAADAAE